MISTNSLSENYRTRFTNGRNEVLADAPVDKGGGGTGPGAHELLEAAFAVCLNMAVRMHAAKNDILLTSVNTQVRLERPDEGTVVFAYSLELEGDLSTEQRQQLEHAASICPVRQTLSKAIQFKFVASGSSP